MQRVITTSLYFEPNDIEGLQRSTKTQAPGISVCWFSTYTNAIADIEVPQFLRHIRPMYAHLASGELPHLRETVSRNFLDFALRGGKTRALHLPFRAKLWNSVAVDTVLEATVIVEQSPPFAIPLRGLIDKSANIVIGTYIGYNVANENHWLMLLTVPGGVMIVGAAIGVSRGLMNGLATSVETAIVRWRAK